MVELNCLETSRTVGCRQAHWPPQTTCLRGSRRNLDQLQLRLVVASDRMHPHKYPRAYVCACAPAVRWPAATRRKRRACRFCGSARRPRGCADNCRKYGRRACVAKVICRVIMGAGNSSSPNGAVRVCCLLRFEEYLVE